MLRVLVLPLIFLLSALTSPCQENPLSPIRIILVGDSTMAVGSGWGPGFCADVTLELTCLNMAKGGRSTKSYREEGSWAQVMTELRSGSQFKATYVLIQFGHNDQPNKPGRSTDLATEFPANLKRYVHEVEETGAKPVLITSLTRRTFKQGELKDTLRPWAESTIKVANEEHIPVLDLNAESAAAVQRMGSVEANTLAMAPPSAAIIEAASRGESLPVSKPKPQTSNTSGDQNSQSSNNSVEPKSDTGPVFDYTHLGPKGSTYFARMVERELVGAFPDLKPYFKPERP